MQKFTAVSMIVLGILSIVLPLLAAQGHMDYLTLGNPDLPASSTLLREHGGHGNVTWAGLVVAIAGLLTFLSGTLKAALTFPNS